MRHKRHSTQSKVVMQLLYNTTDYTTFQLHSCDVLLHAAPHPRNIWTVLELAHITNDALSLIKIFCYSGATVLLFVTQRFLLRLYVLVPFPVWFVIFGAKCSRTHSISIGDQTRDVLRLAMSTSGAKKARNAAYRVRTRTRSALWTVLEQQSLQKAPRGVEIFSAEYIT